MSHLTLASGASFQDRWSWDMDVHQEWVDQITDAQQLAVQKLMRIAILHRNLKIKKEPKRRRKKAVLDRADMAMLNPAERQKLVNEIKKGIKDFIPIFSGLLEWEDSKIHAW